NVVTQQIVELEQRAEAARVRQQGIAGDRERLMEMKAHYAGGAITQRAGGAVAAAAPAAGGIPLPVQTPQAIPAAVMPPAPPAPAPQPL
ncbi:hypothetical protein, partial [Escherichia coli]|uniref:hypothetical protein n=1 Tax=Escherichia coli TaxID=562 RepID=UPI003CE4F5A8